MTRGSYEEDHLPNYEYDPALRGNNAILVTGCDIEYTPDSGTVRDDGACGIAVEARFQKIDGTLQSIPEDFLVAHSRIAGFPKGVRFGDGTRGNKIRETNIYAKVRVEDVSGQNSDDTRALHAPTARNRKPPRTKK